MTYFPNTNEATPLIVVGAQRSGTRFITNVLNSVQGITIQNEIPDPIIVKAFKTLEKCDNMYLSDSRKYISEHWISKRHEAMFSLWANISKGKKKNVSSDCVYYGYKTPFHEHYFDFYNSFFDPVRPKYVCCVRFFLDHYFSVNARWPDVSIIRVARRYTRSLRQLRYMKETRPDDVLLFFLDDYKKTGVEYLREKIFEPLGLEDVSPAIKMAKQGPANASANLGLKKRKTISPVQSLALKIYHHPFSEFESLHHDFG